VADEVQFGLRHCPLQAELEPVVEIGGMIEPVAVGDQGIGQCAEVQELVPVRVIAGQAEASMPKMTPTSPRPTSATKDLKPSRAAPLGPERPMSSSMMTTW
jgi:hypothetical protein